MDNPCTLLVLFLDPNRSGIVILGKNTRRSGTLGSSSASSAHCLFKWLQVHVETGSWWPLHAWKYLWGLLSRWWHACNGTLFPGFLRSMEYPAWLAKKVKSPIIMSHPRGQNQKNHELRPSSKSPWSVLRSQRIWEGCHTTQTHSINFQTEEEFALSFRLWCRHGFQRAHNHGKFFSWLSPAPVCILSKLLFTLCYHLSGSIVPLNALQTDIRKGALSRNLQDLCLSVLALAGMDPQADSTKVSIEPFTQPSPTA